MTEVVIADGPMRAELVAVERRRREALLAVDLASLGELYDDALVHVHAPGVVHNKTQLLEHVATRQAYLDITGDEWQYRLIGDVAVTTGRLVNRLRSPDGTERILSGVITQVLRRGDDGRWRLVSFQMTPDGQQVWPALPSESKSGAGANHESRSQ